MGIPSYFSFIVKSHRNIIKKLTKYRKINNLYLDSNSIIYDIIRNIEYTNHKEFEDNVMIEVCKKISEYINIISPSDKVLIAFDGVAPVAKLDQQRNRRYKSWFQNELSKNIESNTTSNYTSSNNCWDTCSITPGTQFMNNLGDYIRNYFVNDLNKAVELGVKDIIVSCSQHVGEGEHKIFKYIRDNQDYHSKTETIIYGLDADLIMLTLNHLHISNRLYLFRETPHFIRSIDNTLDPFSLYIMDIPELAEAIVSEMMHDSQMNHSISTQNQFNTSSYKRNENKNIIFDYILICFLLGNDFLPHFPSINIRTQGIQILIHTYKETFLKQSQHSNKTKEYLTSNNKIIWKNLRLFISKLAEQEETHLLNEMKMRDKQEKNIASRCKTSDEKVLNIPMLERNIEKYINPREEGWESRYYNMLFGMDVDDLRKQQICMNYLEGLEWTIEYYTSECKDWRWKYNYNYPPLLKDLIKYIPYFDIELIKNQTDTYPIDKYVQLCYVLPRNSLTLLPDKLSKHLLKDYSHLYGTDYKLVWAFCKYFWESHAIMPEINIEELEQLLKNIGL